MPRSRARRTDLDAWTERFVETGARLRRRRAAYAERLNAALATGFRPSGETYLVTLVPARGGERGRTAAARWPPRSKPSRRASGALAAASPARTATRCRSSSTAATPPRAPRPGQVRSLLLALALAALRVYREETGRSAVALLDDLDSELDAERAVELCAEVTRRGQALVTSAHAGWAESLRPLGRIYNVAEGRVACA